MSGNQTRDPGSTRDAVVDHYSGLARITLAGGDIADDDTDSVADGCFGAAAYSDAEGAPELALRASLGCGNPVAVASLNAGEIVLDLGSGGGLDVLLSARRVGAAGTAYGLDASTEMLALARANAEASGVANAVFLQGDIEDIPLPDAHVDVVISNCVICLSADKPRVLAEAYRVLRAGGRLGISDVVVACDIVSCQPSTPEEWIGCVSLTKSEYRDLLLAAGFMAISITSTHAAAPGLQSAIIQAIKPAAIADH
jgi:SAM-dependent methyltransferase